MEAPRPGGDLTNKDVEELLRKIGQEHRIVALKLWMSLKVQQQRN